MKQSNISGCNIIIEDTWIIEDDTTLTDVYIKCYTHDCIQVEPGVNFKLVKSTLHAHHNGRCIIILGYSETLIKDTLIRDCGGSTTNDERGGAIRAFGSSNLKIISSRFENNLATWGGAIALEPLSGLFVLRSTFENNIAPSGAIIHAYQAKVDIHRSNFTNNEARNEGSIIRLNDSNGNMFNNHFYGNIDANVTGMVVKTDCHNEFQAALYFHYNNHGIDSISNGNMYGYNRCLVYVQE